MDKFSFPFVSIATIILLGCAGCSGVKGPDRPDFDPAGSAELAVETYDKDADGMIDEKEVEGSPGLKAAFPRIDTDNDDKLSAKEIEDRIYYYKNAPVSVISGAVKVLYRGKPLEKATVTFEPEPFLGDAFKVCVAETDYDGNAGVSGHDAQFPGIYLGFYRVKISKEVKGKEIIPSKYNEETVLGYEACDDDPSQFASVITFNLK